jgi:crotonobetainyl-CoA:carnitine CoA-transferase CaiB-like acyl-CoA transferase
VTQPLSGIFVADFSRVLAGPLCTQMLADLGATVVKIEEPERGDETRRWGPPFVNGVSAYFLSINRNKRSIAVDLRRGGDVARALIQRADVVVDNFLPSQRASLGLENVRGLNPRVVHCAITGYDSDTPDAAVPGYDLLAQAGAGLMSITGDAEGDPMKAGVALSDVLTAHYAFGAINAALFAREQSGAGASIEISLFSATLASLVNVAQNALITKREAKRHGNAHPSIVPYQLFHAKDRAFAVGAGTDRHFAALCDVVERPKLALHPRFATNAARVKHREKLVPLLERIFATNSARTWVARCRKANIPAALVQGVREALETAPAQPLRTTLEHPLAGAYEALRNPLRIDGARLPIGTPPPLLGQHTDDVLSDLGYSPQKIAELRAAGVIGPRTTSGAG